MYGLLSALPHLRKILICTQMFFSFGEQTVGSNKKAEKLEAGAEHPSQGS